MSKIYENGGITHPCGHEASFDDSCLFTDSFRCPVCGMRWNMRQDPPIKHASGWIEPGKRTLVIEAQREFAL
jgi:transposase-like protein